MIDLSKYSFRNRLITGFGLILFLNITALIISYQKLNQVKQDLLMMYNHPYVVSNALKDIKIVIITEQSALKDLILYDDIEELNSYTAIDEADFHKQFQAAFKLITERYLGNLNDVKQLQKTYTEWQVTQDKIISLIKTGNKRAASQILKKESTAFVKKLLNEKKVLANFARAKAKSLQSKNNDNAYLIFAGLLLSVIIISIFIALLISNSISKPLKAIVNRLNKNFGNTNLKKATSEQEILENAVLQLEESIIKIRASHLELEKTNLEMELIQLNMSQQIELLDFAAIVSETDPKGDINYVNDKFCEISGYSREELIGKNHRILKSGLQPQGLFVGMWAAISKGRVWQGEVCNKRKDGTYYWVMTTILPYKNNKGKIEKYGTVRFEITALKELELKLKKHAAELDAINKLLASTNSELETFSYSVSHDLKAPLRALQGFSKNLNVKYGNQLDETAKRWLDFIQSNAERMDHLITDILSFSRISRAEVKKEQVNMNRIVNEKFLQEKEHYKQRATLSVGNLPIVTGDITMLEMVWQNLMGNAFKYSSKKEEINIEITGIENDTYYQFGIKDNGAGFDMRHYDKLFGIFQRLHTDEDFVGTGVGLANVNRIIQKHGGKIWAEAKVNKGATFEFTISK